jgi:hypothetical protein
MKLSHDLKFTCWLLPVLAAGQSAAGLDAMGSLVLIAPAKTSTWGGRRPCTSGYEIAPSLAYCKHGLPPRCTARYPC